MGNHLAIQIADNIVQFSSFQNNTILQSCEIVLSENNATQLSFAYELKMKENDFLSKEYDQISLSWAGEKSTIVPNNIFQEASAESIFELCYGQISEKENIDYNRIAEHGIINIYELPAWIKAFFVMKYPRVMIQHEGSNILRKAMIQDAGNLIVNLIVYGHYFQLIIVNDAALEFYSFFDYQNDQDVIYHTLFTLQQKELTEKEGLLNLIEGIGAKKSVFKEIENNIAKIHDLKHLKFSRPSDYLQKSQLLCV